MGDNEGGMRGTIGVGVRVRTYNPGNTDTLTLLCYLELYVFLHFVLYLVNEQWLEQHYFK